ncbi:MAG: hypothetical protein BSOLF_1477 [Candidatus Carbobacillus altaicus]|uniref:Uncharacterized protein n=1 Tax=Candidatus Carbonibacillus altaicus TaxID=2163959 RepID=A0A2R6XZE0_9BACL|nr:MAG: hypothetical protein BSOLF_1477 [Candidatus Carbobacillus altaicus]
MSFKKFNRSLFCGIDEPTLQAIQESRQSPIQFRVVAWGLLMHGQIFAPY